MSRLGPRRRRVRVVAVVALPLCVAALATSATGTTAALVDGADVMSSFDALPTLWWASGNDASGEHGDGTAGAGSDTASRVSWRTGVEIPKGVPVEQVSIGDGSACGIAGGRAYCWGDNTDGQLGDGTNDPSAFPVAVATSPDAGSALPAGATVTDISVGSGAACAVAGGDVYCWGDNSSGRLGNNSVAGSTVPVRVATDGVGGSPMTSGTATRVATGGGPTGSTTSFTCAIAADRAYCWGSRENGRLGNGVISVTPRLTPVATHTTAWGAASIVTDIGIGSEAACAVAGGGAFCWGRTLYGQTGDGSADESTNQAIPVAVETSPSSALPATALVTDLAVGATSACAVHDGSPYCWGTNIDGQLGADISTDTEPSTTVVQRAVAVARAGSGASELPVDATVRAVVAGGRLTGSSTWCVLADRPAQLRRAYCWGDDAAGQLGIDSAGDQRVPRSMLELPLSQLPVGVGLSWVAAGEGVTIMVPAS